MPFLLQCKALHVNSWNIVNTIVGTLFQLNRPLELLSSNFSVLSNFRRQNPPFLRRYKQNLTSETLVVHLTKSLKPVKQNLFSDIKKPGTMLECCKVDYQGSSNEGIFFLAQAIGL